MAHGLIHIKKCSRIAFPLCCILCCLLLSKSSIAQQPDVTVNKEPTKESVYYNYDTAALMQTFYEAVRLQDTSPDSAIMLFNQGIALYKQFGYAYGIVLSLSQVSKSYIKKGMYNDAMAALQECIAYAIRTPEAWSRIPSTWANIGGVYMLQGKYQEAAVCLYQAINVLEKYPSGHKSNTYGNIATLLLNMPPSYLGSSRQKAVYYLNVAEKYARQEHNYNMLAVILNNKGDYYRQLKDWDKSRAYINAALQIADKYSLTEVQNTCLATLGEIYMAQDMPEKAVLYFIKAAALPDINPYYKVITETLLGKAYIKLHNYTQAEAILLRAKDKALALHLNHNLLDIYQALGDVYTTTGRHQQALQFFRDYMQVRDSIASDEASKNITLLETQYRTVQKDKEIAEKQVVITQQEKRLVRKNAWLITSAISICFVVLLMIALYRSYRHRQKLQQERIRNMQQEKEIDNLKAIMKGEEKERTRMARELHDGIVSQLSGIKMHLSAMPFQYTNLQDSTSFTNTLKQLEQTIGELRTTAHNLLPEVLLQYGLASTIALYCENMNKIAPVNIEFQMLGVIPPLKPEFELSLYRIIQELLNNIIKHADATQAVVQINCMNNLMGITVEDNGTGMPEEKKQSGDGIGMNNLHNRIKMLQATTFEVIHNKTGGTTVYIEFDTDVLTVSE